VNFDPANSRRELEDWAIATFMKLSYQEVFQEERLRNCGFAIMGTAIEALLVGLYAEGRQRKRRSEETGEPSPH
jgi:hypothetical protein